MARLLSRVSLRWKILLPPAVALCCLLIYLAFTALAFSDSSERLEDIRARQFPLLDVTTRNSALLDNIVSALESAAAAGEADILDNADAMAGRVRDGYGRFGDDARVHALLGQFNDYYDAASGLSRRMLQGEMPPAARIQAMSAAQTTYRASLARAQADANAAFLANVNDSARAADRTLVIGLVISSIGLVLSLAVGGLIAASVKHDADGVIQSLRDIAQGEGDLTRRLAVRGGDELGQVAQAFNAFAEKLHAIVKAMVDNTADVGRMSDTVSRSARTTSELADEQRETSEEVTASLNTVANTTRSIAERIRNAAAAADKANQTAREGRDTMHVGLSATEALVQEVVGASESIQRLAQETVDIGRVLDVIGDIAGQTNLLALNAAIEAARAGEQGRGFAVVADEVRALAERTQASTHEIRHIIERLQASSAAIAAVMQQGRESAQSSMAQAVATESAFSRIADAVGSMTTMSGEIAAMADEQAAVTTRIAGSMDLNRDLTVRNSEIAAQGAEHGIRLAEVAERLRTTVAQFKV